MADELTFPPTENHEDTYVPGTRVGRFRMYDVDVAAIIGVNPAIVLHDLYDLFHYYDDRGQLLERDGDKWFFYQEEECNRRTALTCDQGIGACNMLIRQGLIQKRVMGQPGKRYFRINFQCLKHLIDMAQRRTENGEQKAKDQQILQNLERQKMGFLKPTFTVGEPSTQYTTLRDQIYENREERDDKTDAPTSFPQCDNIFENKKGGLTTPQTPQSPPDTSNFDLPPKKKRRGRNPDTIGIAYGSHVKLTPDQLKVLVDSHGMAKVEEYVKRINRYCQASRPKGYHDYKAVIETWIDRDAGNAALAASKKPVMATNKPETREDRLAMGGKHINPALYDLFVKQGRAMDEYVRDETLA